MNILLVIPPSPFLLEEKAMPFLGIMSIATIIKKYNHNVTLLDLSGNKNYIEKFNLEIKNNNYNIIGFTASTPQYPHVVNLIQHIPINIKKIIGGPHVTSCYASYKTSKNERTINNIINIEKYFDHIFIGDAEISITEFLKGNITSKIINADESPALFLTNTYLSSCDIIDRSFIDLKLYKFYMGDELCASIVSQLGCPFNCSFCCGRSSKNMRKIRFRSVSHVLKEIDQLYKIYGYKAFMFYDDEINLNETILFPLLEGLYNLQKDLNIKFRFRANIKSELFTEKQANLMKQCGFECLLCGFESADDNILRAINKKATVMDNTNTINICKKYNLKIKALMSYGHPGESKDTILKCKNWIIERNVDEFALTIISPYPGSPYYDYSVYLNNNIWQYISPYTNEKLYSINIDYTTTSHFYKGIPGQYKAYVYTDYINSDELLVLRDEVEADIKNSLKIK